MKFMDELLDEAILFRQELQHCIEPFGIPIEDFENAGAAGIYELHEQQTQFEESTFANEIHARIDYVPLEVVRAMCLASGYLLVGLSMIKEEREQAVSFLMHAASNLGFIRGMAFGVIHKDGQNARYAAYARHATDPKQKDKALVRECWVEWQKEPSRYKTKAAFARDMLDKFESLKSQPVIEGWCREWETAPC